MAGGLLENRSSCRGEANVLGRPGSDLLFQALRLSTIGAGKFNGRVRDGFGFSLSANTTRPAKDDEASEARIPAKAGTLLRKTGRSFSVRPFRFSKWALEMRAIKTIELLVPVSSTRCRAYTPGLSTWWSTTALKGELVSRWVSRLDAFSDYPVRT
jgi:hypothetical protein